MFKFLEFLTETIGWLQIAVSIFLIGSGIGFLVYYLITNTLGLVIGIVIASLGLITGIIFATRIWKKTGTIEFLSRTSASPELDNLAEDDENKTNRN